MIVKKGLVSVIIPVYNVAPYLPRCLDSVLGQTYQDLEILLVDDGSMDNSAQICEDYATKDKRVRIFHQQNGGVSIARNTGLDNAHGEFITFVDADDWIDLHAIENYLTAIVQTQAELAWGKMVCVQNSTPKTVSQATGEIFSIASEDFVISLCLQCQFSVSDKLFSRSLISTTRFLPKYKQGEDFSFLTVLLPRITQVAKLDRVVYFYFQRPTSAMHNADILQHQYNQEIGQTFYDACYQNGFQKALPFALSVLLLSSSLYGIYILLLDKQNKYQSQLNNLITLFHKHRKFIFTNHIIWQPARFLIQIWCLFPTFTQWVSRLPLVNPLLRYLLARKLQAGK